MFTNFLTSVIVVLIFLKSFSTAENGSLQRMIFFGPRSWIPLPIPIPRPPQSPSGGTPPNSGSQQQPNCPSTDMPNGCIMCAAAPNQATCAAAMQGTPGACFTAAAVTACPSGCPCSPPCVTTCTP